MSPNTTQKTVKIRGRPVDARPDTIANNLRFPGQYYDQESGLHQNYFRDYDPSLGRYIQSDRTGLVAGLNSYSYGEQNSLTFLDPTGEFAIVLAHPATWTALGKAVVFVGSAAAAAWGTNEAINHFNKPPSDAKDPDGAKAPGKPGEKEGFKDPKGGEAWVPNPNPGKGGASHGWKDKKGNVWVPTGKGGRAHGGSHWDVQIPGGSNINVRPGTHIDQCN